MRKLPNIDDVISMVREKTASEQEKTASDNQVSFTVPVADQLQKVAVALRSHDPEQITYDDVAAFGRQLMENANG